MFTLFLLSCALAADGFAVSICRGAQTSHKWRNALGTGVVFGIVHIIMIGIGWFIGDIMGAWKHIAPYLGCLILCLLGGKMLWESFSDDEDAEQAQRPENPVLALLGLLSASIATSLDGVAGGITLPLLGLPFWIDALMIGGVTAVLCTFGYRAGALIGARWGSLTERMGGLVLIAIGLHLLP